MSDGVLHLALREMREVFWNSKAPVVLLGISAILAVMAPLGTHEISSGFLRFWYWAVVVLLTSATGTFVGDFVKYWLQSKIGRIWALAFAAIATAIGVCVVVLGLNWLIFGAFPDRADTWQSVTTILAISLVISAIFAFMEGHPAQTPPQSVALLERLPFDLRGPLFSLSAEDHYVNVRTAKGSHMLLIRLADAMNEVGSTEGLQVHRSHWVARAAIQSVKRDGDRAILTLVGGIEIPASRKFVPDLKTAGILT